MKYFRNYFNSHAPRPRAFFKAPFLNFIDKLLTLPSDVELQSLAPLDGGTHDLITLFLDFLIAAIRANCDFDLVQAYLNVFLKAGFICI